MRQFLNAAEVARLLGLDKSTVCKWLKKNQFTNYYRPGGSGRYRIPLASCEEWLRKNRPK